MNDFSQAFANEFLNGLAPPEPVVDVEAVVDESSHDHVIDFAQALHETPSPPVFEPPPPDDTVIDALDDVLGDSSIDEAVQPAQPAQPSHDYVGGFAQALHETAPPPIFDILDQVVPANPSIVDREVASNAVLKAPDVAFQRRKWQIDSGQVFGPAGGETTITLTPQCCFRCEKIMATDDSANPGAGTRVLSVSIGQKVQKLTPGGKGTLTQFFSAQALANGIMFDTAHPYETIQIRVAFTQQCNFEMSIFGSAVVDE